jgi:excisionase family DNA binding protein
MTRTTEPNRPTDATTVDTARSVPELTATNHDRRNGVSNVIPITRDRRATRRAPAPQTYKPAEVAQLLGISLSGVYNHLRAGTIPSRRVGSRWLVPRRQFHAWLDGDDQADDVGDYPDEAY